MLKKQQIVNLPSLGAVVLKNLSKTRFSSPQKFAWEIYTKFLSQTSMKDAWILRDFQIVCLHTWMQQESFPCKANMCTDRWKKVICLFVLQFRSLRFQLLQFQPLTLSTIHTFNRLPFRQLANSTAAKSTAFLSSSRLFSFFSKLSNAIKVIKESIERHQSDRQSYVIFKSHIGQTILRT